MDEKIKIIKFYTIFVFMVQAILYASLFFVTLNNKELFNISFYLLEKSTLLLYFGIFIVSIFVFYSLYMLILNKNDEIIKNTWYVFLKKSILALILYVVFLFTYLFSNSSFFQSYSICYSQPGHCDIRSKEFPVLNPADIPPVLQ
jgi:hypothetical protein